MTVESFLYDYPANKHFAEDVSYRVEFDQGHSRIRALVDVLYNEGVEGLGLLYGETSGAQQKFPDGKLKVILQPQDHDVFTLNSAAVLWGAMFPSIEKMLVDGIFHPQDLFERYGKGLEQKDGRWVNQMEVITQEPITLSLYQQRGIKEAVNLDNKTFATFLTEEGLTLLPTYFQQAVKTSNAWVPARDQLYPEYLARARLLNPGPIASPIIQRTNERFQRKAHAVAS